MGKQPFFKKGTYGILLLFFLKMLYDAISFYQIFYTPCGTSNEYLDLKIFWHFMEERFHTLLFFRVKSSIAMFYSLLLKAFRFYNNVFVFSTAWLWDVLTYLHLKQPGVWNQSVIMYRNCTSPSISNQISTLHFSCELMYGFCESVIILLYSAVFFCCVCVCDLGVRSPWRTVLCQPMKNMKTAYMQLNGHQLIPGCLHHLVMMDVSSSTGSHVASNIVFSYKSRDLCIFMKGSII